MFWFVWFFRNPDVWFWLQKSSWNMWMKRDMLRPTDPIGARQMEPCFQLLHYCLLFFRRMAWWSLQTKRLYLPCLKRLATLPMTRKFRWRAGSVSCTVQYQAERPLAGFTIDYPEMRKFSSINPLQNWTSNLWKQHPRCVYNWFFYLFCEMHKTLAEMKLNSLKTASLCVYSWFYYLFGFRLPWMH